MTPARDPKQLLLLKNLAYGGILGATEKHLEASGKHLEAAWPAELAKAGQVNFDL